MKYILPFLVIFFIGCEKKEHHKTEISSSPKIETSQKENKKKIEGLTFIDDKLKFENKKIFLVCKEKNSKCDEEADILKRLKIKYKFTQNRFLIDYFKIKVFPTILIVDKNITKYEGFTPYEILKMEEF